MRGFRGFTLIELMVVVAIIAILAAIAISQYQDYVIRAQIAEGMGLADGVKSSVSEFHAKNGRFPGGSCLGGNTSVGLASPVSITGSYVSQIQVAGEGCAALLRAGSILTVFSSDAPQEANASIDGAALLFEPTAHAGSISWECKRFLIGGGVVLKENWVPSSCR
jgi:type IV pilus assembly protein PilA